MLYDCSDFNFQMFLKEKENLNIYISHSTVTVGGNLLISVSFTTLDRTLLYEYYKPTPTATVEAGVIFSVEWGFSDFSSKQTLLFFLLITSKSYK